jgi:hypothetical protein
MRNIAVIVSDPTEWKPNEAVNIVPEEDMKLLAVIAPLNLNPVNVLYGLAEMQAQIH